MSANMALPTGVALQVRTTVLLSPGCRRLPSIIFQATTLVHLVISVSGAIGRQDMSKIVKLILLVES